MKLNHRRRGKTNRGIKRAHKGHQARPAVKKFARRL
jgi:hypothetical protein